MKKFWGIVAIMSILLLPMVANAREIKVNFDCDDSCVDSGGKCLQTCRLSLEKAESDIIEANWALNGELQLMENNEPTNKITVDDIKADDRWDLVRVENNLTFRAKNDISSGTKVEIATIVFNVDENIDNCSIIFNAGDYGKPEVPINPTPKTGATLPLLVLFGALACGGVFYYVSKKNTKMHKI